MSYRPATPFSTALRFLTPTYTTKYGVATKTFAAINDKSYENNDFFGSFKTYGGTERDVNGAYSIEDTAVIETWYRPDITSDCRIAVLPSTVYEVLGEPENIENRNQYLRIKVRRIKGGA